MIVNSRGKSFRGCLAAVLTVQREHVMVYFSSSPIFHKTSERNPNVVYSIISFAGFYAAEAPYLMPLSVIPPEFPHRTARTVSSEA